MGARVSTIRKDVERHLEAYSWQEMATACKKILKDLKQYPEQNKWQIKYYEKYWMLLNEY